MSTCGVCDGKKYVKCPQCKGTGINNNRGFAAAKKCSHCEGTGRLKCVGCKGTGRQ